MTTTEPAAIEFRTSRKAVIGQRLVEQDILISDLEFHGGEISLTVSMDWMPLKCQWGLVRRYKITESETSWAGRAFMVVRQDGNSDGSERYATFVADDESPDQCECTSHASRGYCVHVDLCRWIITHLLEEGE